MASLFLSYRRADSPDTVKLIHERLKKRLPRWNIFYDHDSIPLGEQFPERLRAKVTSATAVLVIIGPNWLKILRDRRNAPIDHVRVEVQLALEAGASVVPVLVGNTAMLTDTDLADFADLQPLLKRNGQSVRPDPDFTSDLERIIGYLKPLDSDISVGTVLDEKYTLMAEIGHGGMGVVYAAEQTYPVQRAVAIKLIKPGMDSKEILARFDAERQALAVMDHPNISKVLDAGVTANGRPYFAMEYVKGVPITQYCDEKKLTPQERLNLFIPVCNAVQHAHQKGIIHRDLKPSNVLVEVVDGKPVPKVIDFGLAKALGQKLTDKTLYTALDARVGTLEYSAPEQAAGRSFDIDTRSDIYSLGVLLYELLTGATPFTHADLLKVGEEEMRRVIREDEPIKPSKKLSSSGELPAIAACRNLEPKSLSRMVQGDLDWIVMKCLEKENSRRYETANQLGQEIQRFLADEPVQAGPPSASYRAKKFFRRNRGSVIAASLVLLALIAGIIGTGIGLAQAESARESEANQRVQAETNEKKAKLAEGTERKAKEMAEKRLEQIRKNKDLIASIFKDVKSADENDGSRLKDQLVERLIRIADTSDEESVGDAETVADLQCALGTILFSLAEYGKAIELLKKAHAARESLLGLDHPDTFASMNALAQVYAPHELPYIQYPDAIGFPSELPSLSWSNGKSFKSSPAFNSKDFAKEGQAFLELVVQRTKSKFGPSHRSTLKSEYDLGRHYAINAQPAKGLSLLQDTLEKQKATLGVSDPDTLRNLEFLAIQYLFKGEELGFALIEKHAEYMNANPNVTPRDMLPSVDHVASRLLTSRNFDKAMLLHEWTLKKRKAKLGEDHPDTSRNTHELAIAYHEAGQLEKALPLYQSALEKMKAKPGPDDFATLGVMNNLASAYLAAGQLDKAIPLYEVTLNKKKAKLGENNVSTLLTMRNLARAYGAAGQTGKSVPLLELTLEKRKVVLATDHADTLQSIDDLALSYCAAKQAAKAVPLFNEYLAVKRKQLGANDPRLADQLAVFAQDLHEHDQNAAAESMLRECLDIRLKSEADAWSTFNTKSMLGACLFGQKKYKDAEPLLKDGYEGMRQREKQIPPEAKYRLIEARERLVLLYEATGNTTEAERLRKERTVDKSTGKDQNK